MNILLNRNKKPLDSFNLLKFHKQRPQSDLNQIIAIIDDVSLITNTPINHLPFLDKNSLLNNPNVILSFYGCYNKSKLILPIIKRDFHQLYSLHFFNFVKKQKLKIIKGVIIKTQPNKFFVFTQNISSNIPQKELNYHSKKFFFSKEYQQKYRQQKGFRLYHTKQLSFFCETIQLTPNKIQLKLSRNKILQLLSDDATI